MNRFGKFIVSGLAIAAFGAASAQVSKQGNGYLFRMKYRSGEVIKYHMSSGGNMGGNKFTSSMLMTQKIGAVKGGWADVKVNIGDMAVTVNGKKTTGGMGNMMPKEMSYKVDSLGNVKGAAGQSQTSITLPTKPIAIGGTWTAQTSVAAMGGAMTVSAKYTFKGFENVGGKNAAKIAVNISGTGQMAITGAGNVWLDVSDGSMLKNVNVVNVNMGGTSMPVTVTLTRK